MIIQHKHRKMRAIIWFRPAEWVKERGFVWYGDCGADESGSTELPNEVMMDRWQNDFLLL